MTSEMQAFKQAYFAQTGRMAREAMEAKAKAGIYPLKLPIGYKRVFVNGEERIELDPQTAPIIRLVFELIARKRSSLAKALAIARGKGLKGHSGEPISWGALHRLLSNSFYIGEYKYNGNIIRGIQRPLVNGNLWRRASLALKGRIKG
jgi:hypothetical protein